MEALLAAMHDSDRTIQPKARNWNRDQPALLDLFLHDARRHDTHAFAVSHQYIKDPVITAAKI